MFLKINSILPTRGAAMALCAVFCLFLQAAPTFAQAPPAVPAPPPPPGAPVADAALPVGIPAGREVFFKLTFAAMDQYSYQEHPFFQLTGESLFDGAEGAPGNTADIGTNDSDKNSSFLEQVIHALPPFGVEWVWNMPFRFPRGIGVGVDHVHVFQTDKNAADKRPPPTIPRFEMDTFYTAVPVRFYGLDPRDPGLNYFVGFSLGLLSGNLLATGTGPNGEDEAISFSEAAVGATRAGIEVTGENFGFRYEIMLINADEVKFDRNPFPTFADGTTPPTTINMDGSLIRLSGFFKFR